MAITVTDMPSLGLNSRNFKSKNKMKEYKVKVFSDRTVWYNEEGQLHRLNGPAVEYSYGTKYWYKNNKLHRLDGPAIEWKNGDRSWYQNGKLHRLDGPAVERSHGTNEWHRNGKRHRLDGPAVEWPNGDRSWYIEDKYLTEEEFNKRMTPAPCQDREIEIDGVTYILKAK